MLRDKNLVPLSHQHQHVLAFCVRLNRALQAGEVELERWQAEMVQLFEQEIAAHFAAEEAEIFSITTRRPELQTVTRELLAEHAALREDFEAAANRSMEQLGLGHFVERLAVHIRKEERQLFEGMQKIMTADELSAIGKALQKSLTKAPRQCALPNQASTRPRTKS